MFYRKQKVVCVDDSPQGDQVSLLVKGNIYTIHSVFDHFLTGKLGVLLVELKCHPLFSGWDAERFRPVVERKTDISIFQQLLNPANHKHLEGV